MVDNIYAKSSGQISEEVYEQGAREILEDVFRRTRYTHETVADIAEIIEATNDKQRRLHAEKKAIEAMRDKRQKNYDRKKRERV